ncbi:MAG: endonuclease/exonuclease/phosphatase family protein [Chthoniobacteraceae bacterium]
MIHQTRGFLAALFLLALVPVGCSPKPTVQKDAEPEVSIPVQTPVVAAATTPPPAKEQPKAAGPARLRIVAWNLEWFPGHKPNPTPDAEAEQMAVAKAALDELKPDVLLLEEIRDWESAAELCKAVPGMEVHVVSAFQPRPQNQVVASRFTADSTWSEAWKVEEAAPPRGYSFAAVELPDHRFLLTYALHLKSNLGGLTEDIAMRQEATKQLLKHAQEMLTLYGQRGPCAVVFGGDMNTSLDDPKFKEDQALPGLIKAGYHWTHEGVPFADRTTIPAKNGFADNCFDHIFTAGLGSPVAAVKSYAGVSDHNPVVLDVELSKADFQPRIDPAPGIELLERARVAAANMPAPAPVALEVADTAGLIAAEGKPVVVKGRVQKVANTKTNSVYFIDFAGAPRGGFVGIVKQDHYPAIAAALGGELAAMLEGKTIELSGKVAIYKNAPQVIVTSPSQIRVEK